MKKLLTGLIVALMLLPVAAWSLGSNMNFEDGFEVSGVATGWAQNGAAVNSGSNTVVHDGDWSQKCDATVSEGGVQQEISYSAGRIYSIKAWVKCESGATARMSSDGGVTWSTTTSTNWTQFVTTYTAMGPSTLILKAVGGVVHFDNVVIGDINPTLTSNPEFELGFKVDGLAVGWDQYGGSVNSGSNTVFHGGAWSQKCDATVSEGGVQQFINFEAGKNYLVEAWAKCAPGASALISPNGVIYSGSTASPEWSAISVSHAAVGPATMVLKAVGGVVYFDDVTVSVVADEVGIPDPDGMPANKVWWENVNPGGIGGNPFYCGGVFDGNVVLGQVDNCVRMYSDGQGLGVNGIGQLEGTALLHKTPDNIGNAEHASKCATIINGYVWSATGYGDFQVSDNWGELGPIINFNNNSQPRWKQNTDGPGMATDGTHLYAYETYGQSNKATTKIYKWAVSVNVIGGVPHGTITPVSPFPVTIPAVHSRIAGIGYWNGNIYAAETFNGGQIFEINCGTGAVKSLLTAPNLVPNTGGNWGSVARYGDKIFYATHNGNLITWELIGGIWKIVSADYLALFNTPNAYGIAVKGDGVNATGCWITSGGMIHYYDVSVPINLGQVDFSAGGSVNVGKAVVTALGSGNGFWIENEQRTTAAWVPSEDVPTVGNYVSVTGVASKSASGERTITPSQPIKLGTTANTTVEPLLMTNKTLGPATDSKGLATDGMLVTIYGKLQYFDPEVEPFAIYVDDGSGVPSGIAVPDKGVKITMADQNVSMLDDPTLYAKLGDALANGTTYYAKITGIVRLEQVGSIVIRRVDARSSSDIVLTTADSVAAQ